MKPPRDKNEALNLLARAFVVGDQERLRDFVDKGPGYYREIFATYFQNPFLRLTDDERRVLPNMRPAALAKLVEARDEATRSKAPKYVVFCMPKSGSSFVKSALQYALEMPFASLTGFAASGMSSAFGMNGREQEFDEMAIARSVLMYENGFVAQHHTRFTYYLGLQMSLFGLTPIVTVRNIFDCIVSFDDMMIAWRRETAPADGWKADAQFALPAHYPELEPGERYWILARSFGVWLVNFYLSWKRGGPKLSPPPLQIRYEEHVLAPERLADLLASRYAFSEAQRARLSAYVHAPDRTQARLNVGRQGRGAERIPRKVRAFLTDYAAAFRPELDDEDLAYLVA